MPYLNIVSLFRSISIFLSITFFLGCQSQRQLISSKKYTLPNISFEQTQEVNKEHFPVSIQMIQEEVISNDFTNSSTTKKKIKLRRLCQKSLVKDRQEQSILQTTNLEQKDPIKPLKNRSTKGLGSSILGFIFNGTTFGFGLFCIFEFGLGWNWGGGSAYVWLFYLILGIPCLILGTTLTSYGFRKMKINNCPKGLRTIPWLSFLSLLASLILMFLILIS